MTALVALDAQTNLAGVTTGGVINEDLMNKIWDLSRIPLPFLDRVGRGRVTAQQFSWVRDRLAAAADNAWVENAIYAQSVSAPTDFVDSATAPLNRFINHVQTSVKAIAISDMAQEVSSVGGSGGLAYNLMVAQREVMRDIEFSITARLGASVAGVAATTAARAASLMSIIDVVASGVVANDTFSQAGAGITQGGWDGTVWAIPTGAAATEGAITEALIRTSVQNLYANGACDHDKAMVLLTSPTVKRLISEYMFTSSARIGSLIKETPDNGGKAVGSVELFQTDFGVLELVPSRFISTITLNTAHSYVWIFDPAQFELVYLRGPTTSAGAKQGLVDVRWVSAMWSTRFHPEAIAGILGIDETTAMTA